MFVGGRFSEAVGCTCFGGAERLYWDADTWEGIRLYKFSVLYMLTLTILGKTDILVSI
jgi:hypothetical protein